MLKNALLCILNQNLLPPYMVGLTKMGGLTNCNPIICVGGHMSTDALFGASEIMLPDNKRVKNDVMSCFI